MDDLLLHPATKIALSRMAANPAHAIALVAPNGFGKSALARQLAADMLAISREKVESYPYVKIIEPERKVIKIEVVRELEAFFKLKTPGQRTLRRLAIIEHAESMTTGAQSALLKILEEPPADSALILTLSAEQAILPTVLSRVQRLTLRPPAAAELAKRFESSSNPSVDFDRILLLGGGLPGRTYALLHDDADTSWKDNLEMARQVISSTLPTRLSLVEAVAKDSTQALDITQLIISIARAGLAGAAGKQDSAGLKRWLVALKAARRTSEALQASAQPKLAITNLMLQL